MNIMAMALVGTLWAPALIAQSTDTASAAVAAAQVAATAWLCLVDKAHYGTSWDSAAVLFREAATRTEWESAVVQARGPFEPFGKRKLLSATFTTTLPKAPRGQYVILQYETEVSRERTVVETVTTAPDPGGVWRVSGYFIRPR